MLRAAPVDVRITFYSQAMKEIVDIVETKERVATVGLLSVQTCCFSLLETLIATVPQTELQSPTAKIVTAFCATRPDPPAVATGKEFMMFVTKALDGFAHETVAPEPGLEETRRLFHCAAYRFVVWPTAVFAYFHAIFNWILCVFFYFRVSQFNWWLFLKRLAVFFTSI